MVLVVVSLLPVPKQVVSKGAGTRSSATCCIDLCSVMLLDLSIMLPIQQNRQCTTAISYTRIIRLRTGG